jgi:molybdopterin/thiamine biosynthesis adenylyltransferase
VTAAQASGRYARQVLFGPIGEEGQAKLADSRAVLIGCGALGTVAAERLARSGVGHLRIADRDFVELDNLQRQALFNEEHARDRLPKAVAAGTALKAINSEIEVEGLVCDVTPANIESLLQGCDVALDATDNLETRFLLNDACVKLGLPWVHGAAIGSCGQEMLILPGTSACYRCYLPEPPEGVLQGCDVVGVLNTVTGLIAELQVTHVLQVLTGSSPAGGILTYVDVWESDFQQFEVERLSDCPACVSGELTYLNKKDTSWSTSLCGRNAVQISPAGDRRLDMDELLASLAHVGKVQSNGFLLTFMTDVYEMTVFPNGRAIIKGTTDVQTARSLYARYIGL